MHNAEVIPTKYSHGRLVPDRNGDRFHLAGGTALAALLRCCDDPVTDHIHTFPAGSMNTTDREAYLKRMLADHADRHERTLQAKKHLEELAR